jgi:phosphatidylinositol glycan class W
MTIFADYSMISLSIILLTAGLLYQGKKVVACADGFFVSANERPSMTGNKSENRKLRASYLTLSKGATVIFTCIAILAIDFNIFPREYAKTETFGVSLMDFGVGSFMISTACTSKFARGIPTGGFTQAFSAQRFFVLLLGVSRLVSVKLLSYQEHVSEYGMHWNFFVTLFCVWVTADLMHAFVSRNFIILVSVLTLVVFQHSLTFRGLTDYVFSNSRENIFDANKEGIVSLLGYIPLYLIMEQVAYYIFHSNSELPENRLAMSMVGKRSSSNEACFGRQGENMDKLTAVTTHPSAQDDAAWKSTEKKLSPDLSSSNNILSTSSLGNNEDACIQTTQSMRAVDNPLEEKSINSATIEEFPDRVTVPPIEWDKAIVLRLSTLAAAFWLLWVCSAIWLQPTSRRLCNMTYVSFCLALSCTLILGTYAADVIGDLRTPFLTLSYVNQHSLMVFLIANVLTGVVNMTVQTIYAPTMYALCILTLYTFIVTAIPWVMETVQFSSNYSKKKLDDNDEIAAPSSVRV